VPIFGECPIKSYNQNKVVYNLTVNNDHTYYVGASGVLGHNSDKCNLNEFYDSISYHPDYPVNFEKKHNGIRKVKINNNKLLIELNKRGRGWKKVYQDGYIKNRKVSLHYFQDRSGMIFGFKIKEGWSNGY